MKIAACVLLYHPKKKDLNNILSYLPLVNKVYIFDNSENIETNIPFEDADKIIYIADFENKGLSFRLNQACNLAIADGFDFLLTMDQDSYFINENLIQYFYDIKNYSDKDTVGSFGLEHSSESKIGNPKNIYHKEVAFLITSGSVINLNNIKKIGGFDENLFIDGVDYDFCFATLKMGLKCILFEHNYLNHSIGEKTRSACIKTLYLIKKEKQLHAPIRMYYIKRNMLYLEKKYVALFPELILKMKKRYSIQINSNLLYSKKVLAIYKFLLKAKSDFKSNKMGKIQP
jgi:rhamnosyltransferase